jgi:hypothetical protein
MTLIGKYLKNSSMSTKRNVVMFHENIDILIFFATFEEKSNKFFVFF